MRLLTSPRDLGFLKTPIQSLDQAKAFFNWLASEQRCSFHLDDPVSDLVDELGQPAFAHLDSCHLQDRIDECWKLVDSGRCTEDELYDAGNRALLDAIGGSNA